jgi:hypothetical protein
MPASLTISVRSNRPRFDEQRPRRQLQSPSHQLYDARAFTTARHHTCADRRMLAHGGLTPRSPGA